VLAVKSNATDRWGERSLITAYRMHHPGDYQERIVERCVNREGRRQPRDWLPLRSVILLQKANLRRVRRGIRRQDAGSRVARAHHKRFIHAIRTSARFAIEQKKKETAKLKRQMAKKKTKVVEEKEPDISSMTKEQKEVYRTKRLKALIRMDDSNTDGYKKDRGHLTDGDEASAAHGGDDGSDADGGGGGDGGGGDVRGKSKKRVAGVSGGGTRGAKRSKPAGVSEKWQCLICDREIQPGWRVRHEQSLAHLAKVNRASDKPKAVPRQRRVQQQPPPAQQQPRRRSGRTRPAASYSQSDEDMVLEWVLSEDGGGGGGDGEEGSGVGTGGEDGGGTGTGGEGDEGTNDGDEEYEGDEDQEE